MKENLDSFPLEAISYAKVYLSIQIRKALSWQTNRYSALGTTFAADWFYGKGKRGSYYGCKCLKAAFMGL